MCDGLIIWVFNSYCFISCLSPAVTDLTDRWKVLLILRNAGLVAGLGVEKRPMMLDISGRLVLSEK